MINVCGFDRLDRGAWLKISPLKAERFGAKLKSPVQNILLTSLTILPQFFQEIGDAIDGDEGNLEFFRQFI